MKKTIAFALLSMLMLHGCTSTKKTVYFQGIDEINMVGAINDYEVRIMPNDNLHITVSALNPEVAEIFNSMNMSRVTNVSRETLNVMGYLVDSEGYINFPVVGRVMLGGKTKSEAIGYMTGLISNYIDDPIVNIRFMNYKVTILGEVAKPGTYTINDERVTLLEAIGMAGDLTIYGKRQNVLIARETDGVKSYHRIDLTSPEVFTSDYYFLQQNDIVYVQPNKARAGSSTYNQNLSIGVSLISLAITVVALITR